MVHDVFISYSIENKEFTEQLCAVLEQAGLICWIAPRNVRPGSKYAREIVEAIRNCSVMLLVFSDASNKSEHVENEITIAFDEGKTIIPFKITDTQMSPELKYYLNKKHWIDGVPEPEKCFEKLIEQVSLSVPHRSQEIKENEMVQHLENILDEYKQKGINFSNEKLIYLSKKLEELIKEGENQEFQKLLNDFIENELVDLSKTNLDKEGAPPSGKTKVNEKKDSDLNGEENRRYHILLNGAGEILIIINTRPGDPDNPCLVYDGGPRVLLYRSRESSVMLGEISMEALGALRAVDKVLMVEVKDEEVIREYTVPTRNVRSLDALMEIGKEL